jgi:hypothetical protein
MYCYCGNVADMRKRSANLDLMALNGKDYFPLGGVTERRQYIKWSTPAALDLIAAGVHRKLDVARHELCDEDILVRGRGVSGMMDAQEEPFLHAFDARRVFGLLFPHAILPRALYPEIRLRSL